MTKGEWLSSHLKEYGNKTGNGWRVHVANKADVSVHLLEKVINKVHTPKDENCYALARAIGKEDEFDRTFRQPVDAA